MLSPALFTIFSDLLSRILARAEAQGKLSGIKVSRLSPKITHLMYADDLVLYCKANTEEAAEAITCLQSYCSWTGQEINWHKSAVHFSRNTPRSTRRAISRILGIQECKHKDKYLGHPFCQFSSKREGLFSLNQWSKQSLHS